MLGPHNTIHAQSCHVSCPSPYTSLSLPILAFSFLLVYTPRHPSNTTLRNYTPPHRPALTDPDNSWLKRKILGVLYAVIGVLSRPAYAVPLLLNVTGSVWFFVLIGKAELSLTVPITNSLAFLFTVLGEWYAEGKIIGRGTSYM
jgi:hypothetical protein